MKPHKHMRRHFDKGNPNTVQSYKAMCKILHEDEEEKKKKDLQKERWKCYFSYKTQGNKFIIKEIYPDPVVKKNEKMFFEKEKEREIENSINKLLIHKEYREYLLPILLYLLKEENNVIESKIGFAVMCGFFSNRIKGKIKIGEYIQYKITKQEELLYKKYSNTKMVKNNYYDYLRYIKSGVYGTIERALTALQNLSVLEYSIVNVGITTEDNIPYREELSTGENQQYEELNNQALDEVLNEYNEKAKKKKKKIQEKDLVIYPKLLEKYYSILESLIKTNMGYDMVVEYYKIKLTDLNNRISDEINTIKNKKDFRGFKEKLNKRYSSNLQTNALKKYIKEIEHIENLNEVENYEESKQYEKIKYYNKIEIIDQLVSFEPIFDAVDLSVYETPEYTIPEEDVNKTASEIFDEFNIRI